LIRVLVLPVIVFLVLGSKDGSSTAATVVFLLAAATDCLDGQLARRTGAVTDLGKKLDPLADRIFISGTIAALTIAGVLPWLGVSLVIVRDIFMIFGYKVLAGRGVTLRVSFLGKAYTALLMIAIVLAMAGIEVGGIRIGLWMFWAGVAGSLVTGAVYTIKGISQLEGGKK